MDRIITSAQAKDVLERIHRGSGIRPNYWARAAIGLSLSLDGWPHDDEETDTNGREFLRSVLFGEDQAVILALLRQRLGREIPEDELGRVVKVHLERGSRLLEAEYDRLNRRGDELMLHLLGRCANPTAREKQTRRSRTAPRADSFEVSLELGEDVSSGKKVHFAITQPGIAPHVAVMGRNGTGKTRTALSLMAQLTIAAGYSVPVLVFDYAKGDIASNQPFLQSCSARVVRLPAERIPMAPLALARADPHAITMAAHRFRDTICSVVRSLGAKQKARCLDIIRDTYGATGSVAPDLEQVVSTAEQLYSSNGWGDDSLLASMREFTDFPMFRSSSAGVEHDMLDESHVIDVHELPEGLRKLAVFLVLDRLYNEIMALPDAPLDAHGNRQLRLVIAIDEAHHYLGCRQPTLEKMIREVRSKGVGIWLMSQSPDDFDQPNYNFAREMGLAIVFSCVLEKPKMLEALLGGKVNPQRLSQLPAGVALTRIPGSDRPIEVRAWEPQG